MLARIIVAILYLGLVQPALAAPNDFDKVCAYFDELAAQASHSLLKPQQRNQFIVERIQRNLGPESDARGAWEAVSSATASQRYLLFKTAAETVLKHSWSCKSMEKLADKTGEFE